MAKKNSVDRWQDLEQRFHEIGNRLEKVLVEFNVGKPGERIQWTLFGVEEGECRITLIAGDPTNLIPPKYTGNEHSNTSEISDLMRRAGNLLVPHNPKNIWEGADLFLAMTVKKLRFYICSEGTRRFFPNAGQTFGIMSGAMVLQDAGINIESTDWPAEKERDGRKHLKDTPTMTVKTFCRELELSDTIGGQLFHHIRGTTPRKRNRN